MQTTSPLAKVDKTLPFEYYHEHGAIGSSGLKRLAVSPAHYWADYLDPNRERKDKKAWRIGRAWHCAVFEPEQFGSRYASDHDAHPATNRAKMLRDLLAGHIDYYALVELPDGLSKTTKEGKALIAEIEGRDGIAIEPADMAWIDLWLPKLAGKDVLAADNIDSVQLMAEAMRQHPISRVVFERYQGQAEVSVFCRHERTGVMRKIRPDFMLLPCADFPSGLIIDGKSTTDASQDGFARQVWNLDYGLQAAFYTAVFRDAFGIAGRPAFLWAAQEKESPFASAYYAAGADLIDYWDAKIERLLDVYTQCLRTNSWPGYPTSVGTLEMPAWAQKRMEAQA